MPGRRPAALFADLDRASALTPATSAPKPKTPVQAAGVFSYNEYFNKLLKMGIVGTVLFCAPMVFALALAGRRLKSPGQRVYAMAIFWVVGAHLIFGLTGVFFEHASNVLQFAVYLGMLIWLVCGEEEGAQAVEAR